MDFWKTVLVLFRRWYITVPAFIATLGLAAAAHSAAPLEYQSGAILVLTTPLTGGTESTDPKVPNPVTNPLMGFDPALSLAGSMIIQQLRSSEVATAVGITPGGDTGYVVNNGSTNPELLESGPFIFVTGTGPSPAAAQDITTKVTQMAAATLTARQEQLNAPSSTYIQLQVVVAPTAGQPLEGSRLRAAAGAGGLAVLASLAAVYGFESLMTHRRRKRGRKRRGLDEDDPASWDAQGPHWADPVTAVGPTWSVRDPDLADSLHPLRADPVAGKR